MKNINIGEYNNFIRVLGINNDQDFYVLKKIFEKEKDNIKYFKVFDKKEIDNLIKEENIEFRFDFPVIKIDVFNFEEKNIQSLRFYTNKNLNKEIEFLNDEELNKIVDCLVDYFNSYFIRVSFDKEITDFDPGNINLEDDCLEIILPGRNSEDKIFNLVKLITSLALKIKDPYIGRLISEIAVYSLGVNYNTPQKYAEIDEKKFKNIFEYSKLLIMFLVSIIYQKRSILPKTMLKDEALKNIDIDEFLSEEDFELSSNDFYNKLKDSEINPLLTRLDDFNLLQSYNYWSEGNKQDYLYKLHEHIDDDDKNLQEFISKLQTFEDNKLMNEILNKQKELEELSNDK